MSARSVLLVDDDDGVRRAMRLFLEAAGLEVLEAGDVESARVSFTARTPEVVVLDYRLPDGNALDLLGKLQNVDSDVAVVILTGHGSIDLAVKSLQQGAAHFLTKPVEMPALLVVLQRLFDERRRRRKQLAQKSISARNAADPFLGSSDAINQLESQTKRFLQTSSPVLIVGETGVGKGVLARWIHDNGPRSEEPFVHINCAGLSPAFLDAELFGHAKGAFTGAVAAKAGLLEVAHHGTVFLDEVGDVSAEIQPKLLKVLEDSTYRRLGEVRDRTVDVRLVAATNRELDKLMAEGDFRSDLYFRLCALPLRIPPLRERRRDIGHVVDVLLEGLVLDLGRPGVRLTDEARLKLSKYSWPGNIREVRNVLERAVLLSDSELIDVSDLHFDDLSLSGAHAVDTNLSLEMVELRHINAVLAEEDGHVGNAAKRLGVPRSTLYKRIKKLEGED